MNAVRDRRYPAFILAAAREPLYWRYTARRPLMTKPMKIDFVSDVSCPWCVIGLKALEEALGRVGVLVEADIRFPPFELNPQMGPEGQNLAEHVGEKYGSTREQSAAARAML